MTVSLTTTDSLSTIPPTPNDMTSTTSPSPPVSQSTDIDVSSPSSVVKGEPDEITNAPADSVAIGADKPTATDSNPGDETEEETATESAGDDESNQVISATSDHECTVPVSVNKRSRDGDRCDEEDLVNDTVNEVPCELNKKLRMTCEKKLTDTEVRCNAEEPFSDSLERNKSASESEPNYEQMSSENIAEMARLRAAKFIQERTKMACTFNPSSESEPSKQTANPTSAAHNQTGSSRKRKLTVKDILVSQRNRDSGSKQQRIHNESHFNSTNNAALNNMFSGLGQILDPAMQMNESNPFAAISAALAAAASNGSTSNGVNLQSGIVPDSHSYISTLASHLSSNANSTATLALMASLSAMMQNSSNKETNDGAVNSVTAAVSNPLVSLESTLANVMTSNFGQSAQSNLMGANDDDADDDDDHPDGPVPLDFSLKNFTTDFEKSRRKHRKKRNGDGANEDEAETPLDLSLSTKRPDESPSNKFDGSLSSIMPQVPGMDANGSNFAAMAAAAAAAAFSPNLLTKMAASISPWSGYGMQGFKMGNDSATAAVNALLQQMNNSNASSASNKSNTPLSPNNQSSLFQSFPDLYWNGKMPNKTSTASPSFGILSNSTLSSRHHHHQPPPAASQPMRTKSSSGRQNPWQAQWINRSSEQTRDVFTCVWCKESFKSLAEMTDHMKRSPRCGMAGMQQHHSHHHQQHTSHSNTPPSSGHHAPQTPTAGPPPQAAVKMPFNSPNSTNSMLASIKEPMSNSNSTNSGNGPVNSAVSSHSAKPSGVNMPRKLVRGQDVWLGRGAEQTRQILKCMWCGQSFKSLADMTQHMKITQHYTNIISQEQITSWRTPEEKMAHSQVNAVLTCKVCDEAFSSLKELSNHMIKNSHFKESALDNSGRSTPTSTPVLASPPASGRGTRPPTGATSSDRRKKSLPVRKLLELERGEFKKSGDEEDADESPKSPKSVSSQLIECDDCHEKIEPRCFLQHIKQCRLKNAKSDAESEKSKTESEKASDEQAAKSDIDASPSKVQSKKEPKEEGESDKESETKSNTAANSGESNESGSVLNALEKLIEKNFDSKSRRSQQTGILQRLGIDEEVFPPWQNMAPSPLSAMSPTMAAWNSMNGMEFSRSNSSSSTNSRFNSAAPPGMPQLRYRRNSASLKEKFLSGLNVSMKTTESNGSFSSQETEEEESCDESNSDCGSNAIRSQKGVQSRLNFPISSMLPVPPRPTSTSSTASSISPSEPVTPSQGDQLHRMTPSSRRSGQDEEDEENDHISPLALCKKSFSEGKSSKENGLQEEGDENRSGRPSNPLHQLQKLLDSQTDTSARRSGGHKGGNNSNQRMSPFAGWHDSANSKAISPASSPRTPPVYSSPSASAKSDEGTNLLTLKCAFCETQVSSRASYRSHLAKIHLSMRDSLDLSAISDEDLLLLVLAKNSNLPLMPGSHSGLLAAASASTKVSPRSKDSSSGNRRKSSKTDAWEKSPNNLTSSPSASPQLETSQSKFLKYAELAKQLSSKYV